MERKGGEVKKRGRDCLVAGYVQWWLLFVRKNLFKEKKKALLGLEGSLLEDTLVLGKLLGLVINRIPLLLGDLTALSDMSLNEVVCLCDLGVDEDLVVEVEAGGGKERDDDHGEEGCGREPGSKSPDSVKDSDELIFF